MKKLFLLSFALIGLAFATQAQEIADNAIGLRLGDSNGFGVAISYQRALGESNRLEFGLGWSDGENYNAIRTLGLYQWVKTLDGNFNWFFGAGGGFISTKASFIDTLFVAGDIGIEYNFDIPLLIFLDFRPELGFGDFNDELGFNIGLGLRYQF